MRFGMAIAMIYMEIDMLLSKYRSVICSLNGVGWLEYGGSASMTNRFESCVDKWLKRVLERFHICTHVAIYILWLTIYLFIQKYTHCTSQLIISMENYLVENV